MRPSQPSFQPAPRRCLRTAGLLLALGTALSLPAVARSEEKVLYPRTATPSGLPAETSDHGPSPLLLVLAVGAAAAGGWMLWRQRRTPGGLTGKEARKLSVLETRSLGNRQYLVVADYDGRKFLLGVCPGRIDLLSTLDPTTPPPPSP